MQEYKGDEVLGISPYVFLRREQTKVSISHLPHLSLKYGVLTPIQAAMFSLLDGKRSVNDIIKIVSFLTDLQLPAARKYLMEILFHITPDGSMIVRNAMGKKVNRYVPHEFIVPKEMLNMRARLDAPLTLIFQITHSCQADCIYCYACRRDISKHQRLSTKRIIELLDEMDNLGIHQVNFCGGDPFCHPDVMCIVEHAISLKMVVDMSTKAYLNEKTVRRLENTGLDFLQVSVDAADAVTGDAILQRPGQYSRIIDTLKNLQQTRIFTRTNSIITRNNLGQIEEIIRAVTDCGVREMKFAPAFRSMHLNNMPFLLDNDEIDYFDREMARLSEKYQPEGISIFHDKLPDPSRMSKESQEKYWYETRPTCSSGRSAMLIAPDGKVTICEESPQEGEFVVGNVQKNSISQIWNSDAMMEFAFPDRDRFLGTPCFSCDRYDHCVLAKGHCFKDAYKAYGQPFTTNPFCPRAPETTERVY